MLRSPALSETRPFFLNASTKHRVTLYFQERWFVLVSFLLSVYEVDIIGWGIVPALQLLEKKDV